MDHVDYIYLPMTIGEVTTRSNATPKNKGYCFIHFSNSATADLFAARVQQYGDKTMYATQAKFQGVVMNLVNLLDIQSKKWRPRHGVAHVRLSTGELACVQLRPLRNLFKQRSWSCTYDPRAGISVCMYRRASEGRLSAVSTPIEVRNFSFCSVFRNQSLQDAYSSAQVQVQRKTQ